MKVKAILYWTTTALIALETFAGGLMDLTHGRTSVVSGMPVVDVVTQLGYPVYVLTILGVLKTPGAIVLVMPRLPRLKEWAHAGIMFELAGAAASEVTVGNSPSDIAPPLILAAVAIASWALRPASRRSSSRTAEHKCRVLRISHDFIVRPPVERINAMSREVNTPGG
jgi:uncharacterized membrane protein YphA (DoxX/SURF4 family)